MYADDIDEKMPSETMTVTDCNTDIPKSPVANHESVSSTQVESPIPPKRKRTVSNLASRVSSTGANSPILGALSVDQLQVAPLDLNSENSQKDEYSAQKQDTQNEVALAFATTSSYNTEHISQDADNEVVLASSTNSSHQQKTEPENDARSQNDTLLSSQNSRKSTVTSTLHSSSLSVESKATETLPKIISPKPKLTKPPMPKSASVVSKHNLPDKQSLNGSKDQSLQGSANNLAHQAPSVFDKVLFFETKIAEVINDPVATEPAQLVRKISVRMKKSASSSHEKGMPQSVSKILHDENLSGTRSPSLSKSPSYIKNVEIEQPISVPKIDSIEEEKKDDTDIVERRKSLVQVKQEQLEKVRIESAKTVVSNKIPDLPRHGRIAEFTSTSNTIEIQKPLRQPGEKSDAIKKYEAQISAARRLSIEKLKSVSPKGQGVARLAESFRSEPQKTSSASSQKPENLKNSLSNDEFKNRLQNIGKSFAMKSPELPRPGILPLSVNVSNYVKLTILGSSNSLKASNSGDALETSNATSNATKNSVKTDNQAFKKRQEALQLLLSQKSVNSNQEYQASEGTQSYSKENDLVLSDNNVPDDCMSPPPPPPPLPTAAADILRKSNSSIHALASLSAEGPDVVDKDSVVPPPPPPPPPPQSVAPTNTLMKSTKNLTGSKASILKNRDDASNAQTAQPAFGSSKETPTTVEVQSCADKNAISDQTKNSFENELKRDNLEEKTENAVHTSDCDAPNDFGNSLKLAPRASVRRKLQERKKSLVETFSNHEASSDKPADVSNQLSQPEEIKNPFTDHDAQSKNAEDKKHTDNENEAQRKQENQELQEIQVSETTKSVNTQANESEVYSGDETFGTKADVAPSKSYHVALDQEVSEKSDLPHREQTQSDQTEIPPGDFSDASTLAAALDAILEVDKKPVEINPNLMSAEANSVQVAQAVIVDEQRSISLRPTSATQSIKENLISQMAGSEEKGAGGLPQVVIEENEEQGQESKPSDSPEQKAGDFESPRPWGKTVDRQKNSISVTSQSKDLLIAKQQEGAKSKLSLVESGYDAVKTIDLTAELRAQNLSQNNLSSLSSEPETKKKKEKVKPEAAYPLDAEKDAALLKMIPDNESVSHFELICIALNKWELIPEATEENPYMRISLKSPAHLGRAADPLVPNSYALPTSQVISRSHIQFSEKNGIIYVSDSGSHTGTWLNGKRLAESGIPSAEFEVKDGDIVRMGADYKPKDPNVNKELKHFCIMFRVYIRKPKAVNAPLLSELASQDSSYQSSPSPTIKNVTISRQLSRRNTKKKGSTLVKPSPLAEVMLTGNELENSPPSPLPMNLANHEQAFPSPVHDLNPLPQPELGADFKSFTDQLLRRPSTKQSSAPQYPTTSLEREKKLQGYQSNSDEGSVPASKGNSPVPRKAQRTQNQQNAAFRQSIHAMQKEISEKKDILNQKFGVQFEIDASSPVQNTAEVNHAGTSQENSEVKKSVSLSSFLMFFPAKQENDGLVFVEIHLKNYQDAQVLGPRVIAATYMPGRLVLQDMRRYRTDLQTTMDVQLMPDTNDYRLFVWTAQKNEKVRCNQLGKIENMSSLKWVWTPKNESLVQFPAQIVPEFLPVGNVAIEESSPFVLKKIAQRTEGGFALPGLAGAKLNREPTSPLSPGLPETSVKDQEWPQLTLVGEFQGPQANSAPNSRSGTLNKSSRRRSILVTDTPAQPLFQPNMLLPESNCWMLLKHPPPNRSQLPMAEITLVPMPHLYGTVYQLDLNEELLWKEINQCADQFGYIDSNNATQIIDNKFYQREWWSLCALATTLLGFLHRPQSLEEGTKSGKDSDKKKDKKNKKK